MIVTLGMAITLICQSDILDFYKCKPEGIVVDINTGFVTIYEVEFTQCELKKKVIMHSVKSCFRGFEEEKHQ